MDVQKNTQGNIGIVPMAFEEVDSGNYHVKYTFRLNKDDMIFQFFKRKAVGGTFPGNFRSKLWEAFTLGLGLSGPDQSIITIDWVPEADSWFVGISMKRRIPPGDDIIRAILEAVTGASIEGAA